MAKKSNAAAAAARLRAKRKKKKKGNPLLQTDNLLSTGCTLLNLELTGNPFGGYMIGQYYIVAGDSGSGKTWFNLGALGEASINERFDDYDLIYDNAEDGALMDFTEFFGRRMAKRVDSPFREPNGRPGFSRTVQEFYYNVDNRAEKGKPFIWLLDSMDALTDDSDDDKFQENKTRHNDGKKAKGTFGMGKAKSNSYGIRRMMRNLKETNSIMVIIAQTRDNTGMGFADSTYSGGRSLKFYATAEMWTKSVKTLKKTVNGKERKVGNDCRVRITKNRANGNLGECVFPIYRKYGIDDTDNVLEYLESEGVLKKTKQTVDLSSLGMKFKGTRTKCIDFIEQKPERIKRIRSAAGRMWKEIDAALKPNRRSRYE